ncbi:unnamed protein product [Allacma fusca]|uniref:Uncharacterized protein n=1 Tax=Allacma fusca TaxID=39272 RepID=A0A8J2M7V6_9HEXA|nr:unnamed protein product [Allacma fusca]
MEELIAEELEIERRLKKVDERSLTLFNLRDIKKPEDVRIIADRQRAKALGRNAIILQELDFQCGKLHTKRLCPLEKKLNDLIQKTFSTRGSRRVKDRSKL